MADNRAGAVGPESSPYTFAPLIIAKLDLCAITRLQCDGILSRRAVVFRERISYLMRRHPQLLASVSRATAGLAGLVLVAVAAVEIVNGLDAR
ncbi:hypothetical protein NXC14_PB00485 (plasmid) [Rhizobium sp. NXC14]|uniref:hypothetical protein n=1 Tax=Rhizobium sp. NXC14 TaxID=1981173 RepID=UPI000A20BD47|nr:hypothetical protein [Rhizobium sp. NXC14]ARO33305.1 hypothetical protein NXC14_PB00485 [Rhizobium sp. NXC14]